LGHLAAVHQPDLVLLGRQGHLDIHLVNASRERDALQLGLWGFLGQGRSQETECDKEAGKCFHGAILNQVALAHRTSIGLPAVAVFCGDAKGAERPVFAVLFHLAALIVTKRSPDRVGDAVFQGDR
jgi:hypothetical protein